MKSLLMGVLLLAPLAARADRAERVEKRGERMERQGERMERQGERRQKRGERVEHRANALEQHNANSAAPVTPAN